MQVTWPTMASVSVCDWTAEQVAEWLRGLDDTLLPYVHFFLNNSVNGRHLLLLASDDLPSLNITKLGHQDLILEAIDLLRNFHYNLDNENLQSLSLKLSCHARSLYNDCKSNFAPSKDGKQERVSTLVLSTVAAMLVSLKSLVSWLDRNPFTGQEHYTVIRNLLLHISIELTTNAVRDRFAEKPIEVIKSCCLRIAEICDGIIQESRDPLVIQPATINVATVKKKPEEELGLYIHSSYSGIHNIGKVKFQSPAHLCGRIDEGDEVVQVNHQNVVGWQLNKLVSIMRENRTETILTLKKRPHHSNMFSQTLAKSFFFPKKAPVAPYLPRLEWQKEIAVSSQADIFTLPSTQPEDSPKDLPGVEEEEDSAFLSSGTERSTTTTSPINLFSARPRVTVQRRATVTGASPNTGRPPVSIDQLWFQVKREQVMRSMSHDPGKVTPEPEAKSRHEHFEMIRERSPMFLDDDKEPGRPGGRSPRPNTCLGADPTTEAKVKELPVVENGDILSHRTKRSEEDAGKEGDKKESSRLASLDNTLTTLGASLQSLVGSSGGLEGAPSIHPKAASLPRTFVQPNAKSMPVVMETVSNPSLATSGEETPGAGTEVTRSYQVFIAGGVPQVATPTRKDSAKSPNESPVLRRKGRTWEFASRRVSCKDLGMGDCQGWLYKRKDHAGLLTGPRWIKRWCVLKNHNFYCYADKNDLKAESLMYLPGFHVSPAPEVKTRKHSFKVYHSGTSFYYASDSQQDMSKWMNKMGLAAISYDASTSITTSGFVRPEHPIGVENMYYSETEDDGEDPPSRDRTSETDTKSLVSQPEVPPTPSSPATNHNTLPKYLPSNTRMKSENLQRPLDARKSSFDSIRDRYRPHHRKSSFPASVGKFFQEASRSSSTNISSISLQSVRVLGPTRGSSTETLNSTTSSTSSSKWTKRLKSKVYVAKRGSVSFERRSSADPPVDKILPTVVLAPAFEMNLDSSPPRDPGSSNKEFIRKSPNILKKLGLSPRCEKRAGPTVQNQRTTLWFDQELGSSSTISSSEDAASAADAAPVIVSSSSQTESQIPRRCFANSLPYPRPGIASPSAWGQRGCTSLHSNERSATLDPRHVTSKKHVYESIYEEVPTPDGGKHFRTRVTLQIGSTIQSKPEVASSSDESSSDLTRSPRKPAMGVSMIGKQRRSTLGNERTPLDGRTISGSESSISIATTTQATQTDIDGDWDDELTHLFTSLHNADLTIDGTPVHLRRTNVFLMPHPDKRRSQQLLLLRSLERTLKAKQLDYDSIDRLLSFEDPTSDAIQQWMERNPHLCQQYLDPDVSSSDLVEDSDC